MLIINDTIKISLKELDFKYVRSSGPGGQNVNKVNSKAVLRWHVEGSKSLKGAVRDRFMKRYRNRISEDGFVQVSSDTYRDRGRNVADCLEKLRAMILMIAKPPKKRVATKPTRAAKAKRLESKKRQGEKKRLRKINHRHADD